MKNEKNIAVYCADVKLELTGKSWQRSTKQSEITLHAAIRFPRFVQIIRVD
jgi:hypothetical protein